MIMGMLRAESAMTFTRQEVRNVIHDVDEAGVQSRKDFLRKRIVR